ncbi:hypothetical protein ACIA8O_03705 [Kitasatospora sp. NPDC051853]|uniref:hypothetical protein n=1 Tax=Kitasatospora sp. NPDC051853 TaxID=3364058 RepID=UPI00378769C9
MTAQPPRPLTFEAAQALHLLHRSPLAPGLSERELDAVEERFGFRFAADHRMFLRAGLPLGRSWPDWRDEEAADKLRGRLGWPVEGTLFDVGHNSFWHPLWGERPEESEEAVRIAEAFLADAPQLVPVFSHRYLPGTPGEFGHPVLSVYQTDIIFYGADLADYLLREFTRQAPHSFHARATVPFWSYVVGNNNYVPCDTTYTTPFDPYAETAEEALTDLRMLALERALGRHVATDRLVRAGLIASALGVDSPSLERLSGLGQSEQPEAAALFDRTLDELGLLPGLPTEQSEIRWELARWWLTLVVRDAVHPAAGADLLAREVWAPLGRPDALFPITDDGARHDYWVAALGDSREAIVARIRAEAARLLDGPWPPLA